jgi:hypothetical protein
LNSILAYPQEQNRNAHGVLALCPELADLDCDIRVAATGQADFRYKIVAAIKNKRKSSDAFTKPNSSICLLFFLEVWRVARKFSLKVFDGFGSTNAFELVRGSDAIEPLDASASAPDHHKYFEHAPVDPKLATLANPAIPRLAAPANLRLKVVQPVKGFAHFIDTPRERDAMVTYTVYAFDRAGDIRGF